ncbi:MAG TPA: YdeI/OmpD-associated family protein [Polyangiales bacterium]|nr:YdeI/OmpD-associated family protein [Polyangiales bacterium]
MGTKPKFFAAPVAFRAWLEQHHESALELLVGFYKRDSGRPSMTWPESVDEALCFGWIDGVRRSLGADAYCIRFTPRRPGSIWSAINVAKVVTLSAAGKMRPKGERAFAARKPERTAVSSFERQTPAVLPDEHAALLRKNRKASAFFEAQAPWYQRAAIHWVISAKREETRERRLAQLIEDSAAGRTIAPLTRPTGAKKSKK